MNYRTLGNTGLKVSEFCLGSWTTYGGSVGEDLSLEIAKSKTAPLQVETLEQFGCRLTNPLRKQADAEQLRQMHNGELEGRQKLWRWLILTAIGVLIVETLLAGRLSRPTPARAEALAT